MKIEGNKKNIFKRSGKKYFQLRDKRNFRKLKYKQSLIKLEIIIFNKIRNYNI